MLVRVGFESRRSVRSGLGGASKPRRMYGRLQDSQHNVRAVNYA